MDMNMSMGMSLGSAADLYNFNLNIATLRDSVSGEYLPAANYETAHQRLNKLTGEIESFTKDEYVRDENGYPVTCGAWKELCLRSTNPLLWVKSGALDIEASPAHNVGVFQNAGKITDNGNVTDRYLLWQSATSGAPTGIQRVWVPYVEDTSGEVRITFANATAGTESVYAGVIGEAVVTSQAAGALTLISDIEWLGGRLATFLVNFTVKANVLTIGIGPNSTTGKSIIARGASVAGAVGTGDITTERPFTETTGSVITLSSLSADLVNGRGPRVTYASAPKLLDALDGKADGTELVTNGIFDGVTGWTAGSGGILSTSGGVLTVTNPGGDSFVNAFQAVALEAGYNYEFRGTLVSENTVGQIKLDNTPNSSSVYFSLTSTVGSYISRFVSTVSATLYIQLTSSTVGGSASFSNISLKKVSPATGQIEWTGTPSGLPAADSQILACNTAQGLLVMKSDGSAQVNGSRYSATLASAFAANTESKIIIPYEPGELRLIHGEDSTVTDFSGTFGPGTVFGIGPGTAHMVHKSLKIFKRPRVTLDGMTTVYSGTISGLLISAVSGTAFLDACSAITEFADGNHIVEVTDAAGKKIVAVMAAVGSGETLGSELCLDPGFDNAGLWITTFTISGGQACITNPASNAYINQNLSLTSIIKGLVKWVIDVDATTTLTAERGLSSIGLMGKSFPIAGIGEKTVIGTAVLESNNEIRLYTLAGTGALCFNSVSLKQVLTPSTSGVTLVSHLGSSAQTLMYADPLFAYNQTAAYGVTVKKIEV